jgi:hypothetical protein
MTMPDTEWKPGDVILISDHRSTHAGKTAVLVKREVGIISKRPWWLIRLASGALASEFEDSLTKAEETDAT